MNNDQAEWDITKEATQYLNYIFWLYKTQDMTADYEELQGTRLLKENLFNRTPLSFALADKIDRLNEINKQKITQEIELASIKKSYLKVASMLQKAVTEWQTQLIKAERKENADEIQRLTAKIDPISQVITELNVIKNDNISLRRMLEARNNSATILANHKVALEQERHPTLRKALYIASVMLIPFGVGIFTSVLCAFYSKKYYGTFFFLTAAGERKTVGGSLADKALKKMKVQKYQLMPNSRSQR